MKDFNGYVEHIAMNFAKEKDKLLREALEHFGVPLETEEIRKRAELIREEETKTESIFIDGKLVYIFYPLELDAFTNKATRPYRKFF